MQKHIFLCQPGAGIFKSPYNLGLAAEFNLEATILKNAVLPARLCASQIIIGQPTANKL